MSYWNEIAVIAALILLNGLLSMSEAAMMASRKARLQQLANEGDDSSRIVLGLLEDPNVFLSTVQIGITLVGVLAGAVGGATLSNALAAKFATIPSSRMSVKCNLCLMSTSVSIGISSDMILVGISLACLYCTMDNA